MLDYHDNPDPIKRVVDYLQDNDHHEDGAEGEMAHELAGLRSQILDTVNSADSALNRAAEFTGLMAEAAGGLDAEEINAPFNDGGSGYEAHKKLWALRDRLGQPKTEPGLCLAPLYYPKEITVARSGFEKGLEEADRLAPGMSARTMRKAFSAAVRKHGSGGFAGSGYYGADYEMGKAAAYADQLGLDPTGAIRAEQERLETEARA